MTDLVSLAAAVFATAQAAGPAAPPAAWTLETPKATPAIFTYAQGGAPIIQMTCLPATGQVNFQMSVQKRLATRKSGLIWTNGLGMPAPWPASVTLSSGDATSTLRGGVDAEPQTGASRAMVEASTQAPLFKVFARTGVMTFRVVGETLSPIAAKPADVRRFLGVCR